MKTNKDDNVAFSRIEQGYIVRPSEISPNLWLRILTYVYIGKIEKGDLHFLFKPISELGLGSDTTFGAEIDKDTFVICQPFGESKVPSENVDESTSIGEPQLLLIKPKDNEEEVRFATWKISAITSFPEIKLCEQKEVLEIIEKYPKVAQKFLSVIDLKSEIDSLDIKRLRLVYVKKFLEDIDRVVAT